MHIDCKIQTKTSNGVLSKGWVQSDGNLYLIKGNSFSLNNCSIGMEPFSEVLASNLATILKLPHVSYKLHSAADFPEIKTYKCNYVSVCKQIDANAQLVHFAAFADVLSGGLCKDYFRFLQMHSELVDGVYQMLAFDALTGNSDRHLNNIDILFDGKHDEVAPILDNGASFLSLIDDNKLKEWIGVGPDKAKPFKDTHERQMQLFRKHFGSIVLCNNSVENVFNEWFAMSKDVLSLLPPKRANSICIYLRNRLKHYEWMFDDSVNKLQSF